MAQTVAEAAYDKRRARLEDVRYIGMLSARYALASRRGAGPRKVQVFACRIQSISPKTIVMEAPVLGAEDERVTVHIPDIGLLNGRISRFVENGFAVDIDATPAEREVLGGRIAWIKRKTQTAVVDKRAHRRWLPRMPKARLILSNGQGLNAFLIDVSRSGVAVSADIFPEIGMPLAVGRVLGRVVRHLEVGFAVQFLELQDADTLEASLGFRLDA